MRKYLLPVIAACILGAGLALFLPMRMCLTVTDARGKCVWAHSVSIGDRYTVRFIHSVMRTPVDEIYEIEKECSVLRETVYDMMGAGLPSAPEEGQTFSIEDDKFHIRGYSLRIPVLTYRINKVVADHELLFWDKVYKLKEWTEKPGEPLTFKVERRSFYDLISNSR